MVKSAGKLRPKHICRGAGHFNKMRDDTPSNDADPYLEGTVILPARCAADLDQTRLLDLFRSPQLHIMRSTVYFGDAGSQLGAELSDANMTATSHTVQDARLDPLLTVCPATREERER